jgi:biopolymer transport protein ExbB/TolQ
MKATMIGLFVGVMGVAAAWYYRSQVMSMLDEMNYLRENNEILNTKIARALELLDK